jgi:hypothetical protein
MATRTKRFGTFEGDPAVWDEVEAWVLTNGIWHEGESFKMIDDATLMTEEVWNKYFPGIFKTLPKTAFKG